MKQFLLYVLYVGIFFVIQMPFLLVRGLTDGSDFWKSGIGAFFEAIYFGLYMIPGAIISLVTQGLAVDPILVALGVGTETSADLETRRWLGGILLWFDFAVVALAYSLLIGAVLWVITFIIGLIRKKAIKS